MTSGNSVGRLRLTRTTLNRRLLLRTGYCHVCKPHGLCLAARLTSQSRAGCCLTLRLSRMAHSSALPEPTIIAPAKPFDLCDFLPQVPVFSAQRDTLRAEVSWTVAACRKAGGGKSGLHRAGCRLMAGRREARNRATETSLGDLRAAKVARLRRQG